MDLLTEQVQFNTYESGEDIEKYLKDLISFLEDEIYGEIVKRVNRLLKITVDSNGNVGIGTTNPTRRLHISSSGLCGLAISGGSSVWYLDNRGDNESLGDDFWISDGGAIPEFMIDKGTGNVGIGTTTPKSKLHVVGLPVYANNAAAISGGLTAGAFYRTNADPDPVCVVH